MRKADQSVTIPDPGDILFPEIRVEAIQAYGGGGLPDFVAAGLRIAPRKTVEDRVRVAQVKVDGIWVEL